MRTFNGRPAYGLPRDAKIEGLLGIWMSVAVYGDKVILADISDPAEGLWFGAIYGFTTDDRSMDGPLRLMKVSDGAFPDGGHALEWAMRN